MPVEWTKTGDLFEHAGAQWLLLSSNIHCLPSGLVMRVETAIQTMAHGGHPFEIRVDVQPHTFVTVFHAK